MRRKTVTRGEGERRRQKKRTGRHIFISPGWKSRGTAESDGGLPGVEEGISTAAMRIFVRGSLGLCSLSQR